MSKKSEIKDAAEYAKENILKPKPVEEYEILASGDGHEVFCDPITKQILYMRMPARRWREMGFEPGPMVPDGEMIRYKIAVQD